MWLHVFFSENNIEVSVGLVQHWSTHAYITSVFVDWTRTVQSGYISWLCFSNLTTQLVCGFISPLLYSLCAYRYLWFDTGGILRVWRRCRWTCQVWDNHPCTTRTTAPWVTVPPPASTACPTRRDANAFRSLWFSVVTNYMSSTAPFGSNSCLQVESFLNHLYSFVVLCTPQDYHSVHIKNIIRRCCSLIGYSREDNERSLGGIPCSNLGLAKIFCSFYFQILRCNLDKKSISFLFYRLGFFH